MRIIACIILCCYRKGKNETYNKINAKYQFQFLNSKIKEIDYYYLCTSKCKAYVTFKISLKF